MGFNCGIVGLPNVGKSTLFNAITQTAAAECMNYPFCTIEPNVGVVAVQDPRLYKLAEIARSQKIVPTQLDVVDIAGLVRGAGHGEGLGNKFLGHIRQTDAMLHVVRCFDNNDITHVNGTVDPLRDIDTIETELILSDIDILTNRIKSKKRTPESEQEKCVAEKILSQLENGQLAITSNLSDQEKLIAKNLNLITFKPVLYVCNVNESDVCSGNKYTELVKERAKSHNSATVIVSAAIEAEIAMVNDPQEKKEFIESIGLSESGLARVVHGGYNLLSLQTFFTVGPKEAHAWTTKKNATAPMAAGEIHSDFERGFICAETISYADYVQYNGEAGAKAAGKMRLEGKEYIINDGDIFHFRFNV